ncbi:MAG: orotate phosphoribosyltransferase [Chloroflexota bacterium]|nr:orotate phosphoribosyltransferase [Chloroflexota bacterium]
MPLSPDLQQLGADIVAAAYLTGDFILSSGKRSNYYFDKYLFETQPSILCRLGKALAALVPAETEKLACPELGAVLLCGAVSMELDLPMVILRKEAKGYSTAKLIEGKLEPGQRVAVIEDVLTTGAAAIRAAQTIREAGASVIKLIAVLDREEGAAERLRAAKLECTPLFRKSDLKV